MVCPYQGIWGSTKVQACHQKCNVDPHHTCRSRCLLYSSTPSQKCSQTTRTVCGRAQILMKSYNGYLSIKEAGKDLILYTAGNDALAPLKKTEQRFWQLDGTLDDQPSTSENCNQDDDSADAQVQGHQVQQPLGPNHKHHCVLHAAQPVPGVTQQIVAYQQAMLKK
jgi:hypothetical protein